MSQAKEIEVILGKNGDELAIVIRSSFGNEGVNFISKPEDPFQVGVSNYLLGHEVKPHRHNTIEKINNANPEFIYIIKGEVEATFYDNNVVVKITILTEGDALLQLRGGHGFKMLKETKLIELKQGPYYGNAEKEYLKI